MYRIGNLHVLFIAAVFLLSSGDVSSDVGGLVEYSSQCPSELTEQFRKMTPKQKSKELQKLRAANTTALMMSNFMSEYVNWDEFLYDLPIMVTELGKLMLFSNKRDFTLYKEGVTYKYITRPESFRATLVQLAHTEWNALHSAHHNMDTIRINSISIPGVFRMIFRIIARKKTVHTERQLKMQLDRVLSFARENKEVCADSIEKIYRTINLISEIQEATLSAQSEQKDRLNLLRKEKAELEVRLNSTAQQLEKVGDELNRQREKVERFESDYRHAQKKATPKIGEVLACTLIDFVGSVPQMFSSVFNRGGSSGGGSSQMAAGGLSQQPKGDESSETVNELQEAQDIVQKAEGLLQSTTPNSNTYDLIDGFIAKLKYFKFSSFKSGLLSLLSDIKSAFKSMGDFSDEKLEQFKERLQLIAEKLQSASVKALAQMGASANSPMLNNQLDQIGESSAGSYGIIMNARLAQLKMATEVLINANDKYEKLFNKKMEVIREHDGYFAKLATINFNEVDFETILQVMREGIQSLGRHVEHWKRLLEFFKIIEQLTLLANKRTELFVNGTLIGVETGALMGVYENDDIYMDMLYEHSYLTVDIARALYDMTSTYMRVSNTYVFPQLNGITKLLAIEDPNQINNEFVKLGLKAEEANTQFKKELKAEYQKQKKKVEDRVRQVACYIKLVSEDPDIKDALEEAGEANTPDLW